MEDKINILPLVGNGGGGTDTATAMALANNNPWMYLVMLALFGGGGFGFGNRGGVAANGVLDMETQNKLNALSNQINTNQNNDWAREAIMGNTAAISQLSQTLGINYNAVQGAIAGVQGAIAQLGAQNGMGFAGVTNAINLGNLNLIQQLKDCCCATQKQILEQGYQGRIETINQTNDLQTSQRVESGLVRAEIASFRQAWEQKNYQDKVAEVARLQTELDLLRQNNNTQAAIAAQVAPLKSQMEMMYFKTFGFGAATTQAAG